MTVRKTKPKAPPSPTQPAPELAPGEPAAATPKPAAPAKAAAPPRARKAPGPAKPPKPVAPVKAAAPRGARTRKPAPALRVLMLASELHPFSKTGGLADVASALPRALGALGHQVTVVTPRYRGIAGGEPRGGVRLSLGGVDLEAGFSSVPLGPGAEALFVDCPPLYDRAGLYNENNVDYGDNALRFAFLCRAALEWAADRPEPFDVLHGHDWQAGLAPAYLRGAHAGHPVLGRLPAVFTIHNLAYQGIVDKAWVPRLDLGWDQFRAADGFEFYDRLSLLKAGVSFSDVVTTVSPTYAEEIQRPEYGYGFDGVMRARQEALVGILNGIDVEHWDPASDPHLPAPYDAANLDGKRAAKRALLETFGLPTDDETLARPVVGLVSRLVDQKGFDLIEAIAGPLIGLDATFVLLGSGDPRYQALWQGLRDARPDRVGVFFGFDERRAHLVEAGADVFLMPSRYEPCGLNQMYSLRYGTVPVVRATGGLVDTVSPWAPKAAKATGFLFADYSPAALLETLQQALELFRANPKAWRKLQATGMAQDFSWRRSAEAYASVYKGVMRGRR